jgi:excisionase family DNA binding protein
MIEKEYLTTEELADYLNMSKKFIIRHRETGRIPGIVKIGRVYRYRRIEIEKRLLSGTLLLDKWQ